MIDSPRAMPPPYPRVSVVIPAKNEAPSLERLLPRLREVLPNAELIVVDDGSDDGTGDVARELGASVVRHPYGKGNGAAVKSGVRSATGDVVVLLDGDGQHDPDDIPRLLSKLAEGYDMVIGARDGASQASIARRIANGVYNRLASYVTAHHVHDLTSGFRVAWADRFREFLHLLPNGFSYPTTSTIAFFRAGYSVGYVPVVVGKRTGRSHIRPLQDGLRFLLIIMKIATLYSPLKLFFPISVSFFLVGLTYYLYTYVTTSRFTNMSALMFTTAVLVFLIGLVSEQITQLIYSQAPASRSTEADAVEIELPASKRVRRTGT